MSNEEQDQHRFRNCLELLKRIFCYYGYDFSEVTIAEYDEVRTIRKALGWASGVSSVALFFFAMYTITQTSHPDSDKGMVLFAKVFPTVLLSFALFLLFINTQLVNKRIENIKRRLSIRGSNPIRESFSSRWSSPREDLFPGVRRRLSPSKVLFESRNLTSSSNVTSPERGSDVVEIDSFGKLTVRADVIPIDTHSTTSDIDTETREDIVATDKPTVAIDSSGLKIKAELKISNIDTETQDVVAKNTAGEATSKIGLYVPTLTDISANIPSSSVADVPLDSEVQRDVHAIISTSLQKIEAIQETHLDPLLKDSASKIEVESKPVKLIPASLKTAQDNQEMEEDVVKTQYVHLLRLEEENTKAETDDKDADSGTIN